jgi:hypothetical protein
MEIQFEVYGRAAGGEYKTVAVVATSDSDAASAVRQMHNGRFTVVRVKLVASVTEFLRFVASHDPGAPS